MNNEIEAQFLDIDKDKIRTKLKNIGAKLEKPEVLMKRVVFYTGKHLFARVRDEGEDVVNLHTPEILFDMEPPEWTKRTK